MRVIKQFDARPEGRLSLFDVTTIGHVPFQLLPRVVYSSQQRERGLKWQNEFVNSWGKRCSTPKFTLLVDLSLWCSNLIQPLFESIAVQSYQNVEMLFLCPNEKDVSEVLDSFEQYRIPGGVWSYQSDSEEKAEVISQITHSANGSYVMLLGGRTILHPQALFILAKSVMTKKPDLLYVNEVELSSDMGCAVKFFRKTAVSKYSVMSMNVFGESVIVAKEVLGQILESVDLEFVDSFSTAWGIGLQCMVRSKNICHIPLALQCNVCSEYKSPQVEVLEAIKRSISEYALNEGIALRALEHVGSSQDITLQPLLEDCVGKIQVIIPFKNESELTTKCLASLKKQDVFEDLEITLVDNGSTAEHREFIDTFIKQSTLSACTSIISDGDYFNYARLNNLAASHSNSPYILLLNNDVELRHLGSVRELRKWCSLEDVAVVGGSLYYDEGNLQHGGINFTGVRPCNVTVQEQFCNVTREVNAVTFAMALLKREVFDTQGGLNEEHCPNGFGDALYCHALSKKNWKTVFTPLASGTHHESRSRSRIPEELELYEMTQQGLMIADLHDDFYANNQPTALSLTDLSKHEKPLQVTPAKRLLASVGVGAVRKSVVTAVRRLAR